jgi:glycosyltransferase involved in cell wall biosynthesis
MKGGYQSGNVWSYVPFGLIPVAGMFPFNSKWAIDHAGNFLVPPLKKKLRKNGFQRVQTIWLNSPLFGYLLDMIPHETSVLRVGDDLSGFGFGEGLAEAERSLAQRVDLVVVTSSLLEAKMKEAGAKRTLYLPNGVDYRHFADDTSPEPDDLRSIPAPRVLYVGAIESWFDDERVAHAAEKREDLSFVIIGPYETGTFPRLEKLHNVFLLGRRDYTKVPSYMKHSQVGMIPFRKQPFVESINPIKLYEYMACGLPVVATKWKTLEDMASPALLVESKEEFLEAIDAAVKKDETFKHSCVQFADENSWSKRLEKVKEYL